MISPGVSFSSIFSFNIFAFNIFMRLIGKYAYFYI